MVSLDARLGRMDLAVSLFETMPDRTIVSWNAIITGYNQNGLDAKALRFFSRMLRDSSSMVPDEFTITSVLSACANLRMVSIGKQVHAYILTSGMPCRSGHQCAISMYAKSGSVENARGVMDQAVVADLNVISFTALLEGYVKLGDMKRAREIFDVMSDRDVVAWTAMIVGYEQNGHNDEAMELFRAGGARAEKLLSIDPGNSGLLPLQCLRPPGGGATRRPGSGGRTGCEEGDGFSWTTRRGRVHVFGADLHLHPQREAVYRMAAKTWQDIKKAGFIPDLQSVLHDVDDELKEEMLSRHSEKLAIAARLLATPEGMTLRS
ncbi:hypothetical protein ZWY2020_017790 [Hordeum vulgare]|nr:hypothetical protein ZWY2020_017790 [Hordeum vulgare]